MSTKSTTAHKLLANSLTQPSPSLASENSVEFLSDVHLERYGRFQGDPTPFQLAEYFVLTPRDLGAMDDLRHPHTRLGFALQLCTLCFLSTFLLDPADVPGLVLRTLCEQLGLADAKSLPRYCLGQDGTVLVKAAPIGPHRPVGPARCSRFMGLRGV